MIQLIAAVVLTHAQGPSRADKNLIETYGNAVRGYLLEQPTDGRFGFSRVPSIHDLFVKRLKEYEKLRALTENYRIYSFLVGTSKITHRVGLDGKMTTVSKPSEGRRVRTVDPNDANQDKHGRCIMRLYDKLDWEDPTQGGLFYANSRFPVDSDEKKKDLQAVAKDLNAIQHTLVEQCFKSKADTTTKDVKVTGKPSWVSVKTVIPRDKSCYKCHEGVKEGEPIGEILTFLIKKDAHESR